MDSGCGKELLWLSCGYKCSDCLLSLQCWLAEIVENAFMCLLTWLDYRNFWYFHHLRIWVPSLVMWLQSYLFTKKYWIKMTGYFTVRSIFSGPDMGGEWQSAGTNKFLLKNQELRQCTNLKSDSSRGRPHWPWRNVDSERGQVHLGCASVYLPPSSSTLRWSCTR